MLCIVGNNAPNDPSICLTRLLFLKPIADTPVSVLYAVAVPLNFIIYVPAVVYLCEYVVLVVFVRLIVCTADPSPQSTVKFPLAEIEKLKVVSAANSVVLTQNLFVPQSKLVYACAVPTHRAQGIRHRAKNNLILLLLRTNDPNQVNNAAHGVRTASLFCTFRTDPR